MIEFWGEPPFPEPLDEDGEYPNPGGPQDALFCAESDQELGERLPEFPPAVVEVEIGISFL